MEHQTQVIFILVSCRPQTRAWGCYWRACGASSRWRCWACWRPTPPAASAPPASAAAWLPATRPAKSWDVPPTATRCCSSPAVSPSSAWSSAWTAARSATAAEPPRWGYGGHAWTDPPMSRKSLCLIQNWEWWELLELRRLIVINRDSIICWSNRELI